MVSRALKHLMISFTSFLFYLLILELSQKTIGKSPKSQL